MERMNESRKVFSESERLTRQMVNTSAYADLQEVCAI